MGLDVKATGTTGVGQGSAASNQGTTTVKVGETKLADVARRLGVSEQALQEANPQIKNTNQLKAGQDIRLPKGTSDDPWADSGPANAAVGHATRKPTQADFAAGTKAVTKALMSAGDQTAKTLGNFANKVADAIPEKPDPWTSARAAAGGPAHVPMKPMSAGDIAKLAAPLVDAGKQLAAKGQAIASRVGDAVGGAYAAKTAKALDDDSSPQHAEAAQTMHEILASAPAKQDDAILALLDQYHKATPKTFATFLIGNADVIGQRLAPFGFTGQLPLDDNGNVDTHRMFASFHDAMERWRQADGPTRQQLRAQMPSFGGKTLSPVSGDEIKARNRQEVEGELSDGSVYAGPRWAYNQESNHAVGRTVMQKMDGVINSGPSSLLGRAIWGEKGAALGAMIDIGLGVAAAAKGARSPEEYEGSPDLEGTSDRAAEIGSPPSPPNPAETQPNRPPTPAELARTATPEELARTANPEALGKTEVDPWADTGKVAQVGTAAGGNTGRPAPPAPLQPMTPEQIADMAQSLEQFWESIPPGPASGAPGAARPATAQDAINQIAKDRDQVYFATDSQSHARFWNKMHGMEGPAPVVYQDPKGMIHVDWNRLSDADKAALISAGKAARH